MPVAFTSEWTSCTGKQGRNDVEQADFEVAAAYKHKLTREYHAALDAIAGGAHFFKPMLAKEYTGWQGPWTWVRDSLDIWLNVLRHLRGEPLQYVVG